MGFSFILICFMRLVRFFVVLFLDLREW